MKNIHLIKAESSHLSYNRSYRDSAIGTEVGNAYWTYSKDWKHCMSVTDKSVTPYNIYITSDEEIKDGDYYLYLKDNSVHKFIYKHHIKLLRLDIQKKIILTTDQDLIKDGVQAIDDEFLEWFVKNPSYEKIKIEHEKVLWETGEITHYKYKIIIPKEESKQKWDIDTCRYFDMEVGCEREKCICENISKEETYERTTQSISLSEVDTQETLEEYIEKLYPKDDSRYDFTVTSKIRNGIREGAKWQQERSQKIVPFDAYNIEVFAIKPDKNGKLFAYIGYKITNGNFHFNVVPFTEPQQERMYSEEELLDALKDYDREFKIDTFSYTKPCSFTIEEWFEQFKNK